jgi:peptide chain release factor 3
MFFGSAMTNFGVQEFLERFLKLSPQPQPRQLQNGEILQPDNEAFSAFIFKIQANMNPAHRDRISFMRICSGIFEKGMMVYHLQSNKLIKLAQPQQFMAQERTIVEKAYPGDIIGVFDPGIFGIGDSLSDEKLKLQFEDFPVFPPEIFARVQPKDSLKRKQFEKGIDGHHRRLDHRPAGQAHEEGRPVGDRDRRGPRGVDRVPVLPQRVHDRRPDAAPGHRGGGARQDQPA